MEGSYFPEDKDLAHKIMMDLSNSDLVKMCAMNKRMYNVCNNYPSFWRNKFIKDYGEHAAQYKPENRTWKNHYMTVFIDLQKYAKDPIDFLRNIAWKENVENSYFIDKQNNKLTPLKDAPEWVMNNLYLLNLVYVKLGISLTGSVEYKNIKPIELLQQYPSHPKKYLQGFQYSMSERYNPRYKSFNSLRLENGLYL